MPDEFEKQLIESGLDPSELEDPEEFINHGFKQVPVEDLDAKIEKDLKGFTDLLGSLASTEDRKKALWKQIYENALMDRRNAFILFGDLYNMTAGKSAEHAIHGATLAKYLERMSKANDQMIKLADLVSDALTEEEEADWNEEGLYANFAENDLKGKKAH